MGGFFSKIFGKVSNEEAAKILNTFRERYTELLKTKPDARSNEAGNTLYTALQAIPADKRTFAISLENSYLGDVAAIALCDTIKKHLAITDVSLVNCSITSAAGESLVSLVKDASLYTLDLSENTLGDHVAEAIFGALGQNNSLKALHLRGTKLSDAVVEALKSDMNDMLRHIDLKNNALSEASLELIKQFLDSHYHVIGFDLDGNKLSAAQLTEIEKLLERNYSITNVMDDLLNAVPYRRKHAVSRTRVVINKNNTNAASNTNLSTSPSSPPNRFNRSYSKTGPKKQLDPLEEFPWLALVNFEKFPKVTVSNRFRFGLSDTIGRREAMEDAVIVHGQFREKHNEDLFAVFDGHGGREVADYCAKSLAVCLKHKLSTLGEDQIGEAMTQAYVEIDRSIQGWAKYVGCCALSAYFIDHFFYIANVGDSRVVLAQAGKAQRLSTDHKPEHPEELKRIKEAGGFVNGGRVKGLLSVSRAIGDALLTPVIAVPDIIKHEINDTDELLILACDGLWDVISDQQAVSLIRDDTDMQAAAERLRNYALDHGSTDNISVLVIDLKSFTINRQKLAEEVNNTNQVTDNTDANAPTEEKTEEKKEIEEKEEEVVEEHKEEVKNTDAEKVENNSTAEEKKDTEDKVEEVVQEEIKNTDVEKIENNAAEEVVEEHTEEAEKVADIPVEEPTAE